MNVELHTHKEIVIFKHLWVNSMDRGHTRSEATPTFDDIHILLTLEESHTNSERDSEHNQRSIKLGSTLATPSNSKEDTQEYTQSSKEDLEVYVHSYKTHTFYLILNLGIFVKDVFEKKLNFS